MDLSKVAFKKSVLHSLKHGSVDVIGVLISNGEVISDVIPLFHESVVGPSLDVAFRMLQSFYLNPNPSYKIVGVYESSVNAAEGEFLPSTFRILEVIREANHEQPFLLSIKNKEGEDKEDSQLDITLHKQKSENKVEEVKEFTWEFELKDIEQHLTWTDYLKIVDFDDHFENPAYDWRNEYFNE